MSELHFDQSLNKIQYLFKIMGFNINIGQKRSLKQNCLIVFNLLWLLTDCVCTLMQVVIGYMKGEEFTVLTYIAACSMYLFLSELRSFLFLLEENKINVLISNLKTLEIKANGFDYDNKDEVIKTEIKRLDTLIKGLTVFNYILFSLFDVVPILITAVQYITTGKLELFLPILDCYPFDSFDIRYWPYAFGHQFWSAIICLSGVCATDFFYYTCCTYIRIQFKLLQHQFRKIIPSNNYMAADHSAIRANFSELIKWHQEIISAAKLLKDIYSKSILCNFFCSSLTICLTGFNVTANEEKIQFVTFLLTCLMQVFFLCLFGDILMSSSMDVLHAVYDSKWYESDVTIQKNIIIVLRRAQNPCKLTAAGFADVHLGAHMKIMSTSWSYFALLQTIYRSHS